MHVLRDKLFRTVKNQMEQSFRTKFFGDFFCTTSESSAINTLSLRAIVFVLFHLRKYSALFFKQIENAIGLKFRASINKF